jgi:hypothetical protein
MAGEEEGMAGGTRIPVRSYMDLPVVRRVTEAFAAEHRLWPLDRVVILSVVADVAHHIAIHGRHGEIVLQRNSDDARPLTVMIVRYAGAEVPDSEVKLSDVKRLMDEITIAYDSESGTIITARRWDRPPPRAPRDALRGR